MEHALLGWPKGNCHRDAKKTESRVSVTTKLTSLGKTEEKILLLQSYVNVVKLVCWVAELVLGDCHNIDGEFGKLILNLSLHSSMTLAP